MAPASTSPYTDADMPDGTSQGPLLAIRSGVKRYGGRPILNIAHLEIGDGERIELIGSNASGKSTLARILAGQARLTKGRLDWGSSLGRGRIAFLPQSGGLYRDLTLMQNVITIARLYGRKGSIDAYGERILFDLGLLEFLDKKAALLSGGTQKLAALAALIVARPAGLILDEPFAGLDAERATSVRAVLSEGTYPVRFIVVTGHAPMGLFRDGRVITLAGGEIVTRTGAAPQPQEAQP